jgi:hypothetical protein
VRAAYDDGVSRIREARGNYDAGLVEAQKMAIAIGGYRGYKGFEGFSLASLDTGQADHQIAQRPVIDDTLGIAEQVSLTLQAIGANAPAAIYHKLGWGNQDIEEIEASQALQTNLFLSSQLSQPATITLDETPQEASQAVRERRVNEATLLEAQALLDEV